MSQLPSLTSKLQDPNWVSVPITKFSHNTSPYGTRSFVWVHVNNRKDLDLVIRNVRVLDDYGNYQDRILMKVTGGAEIMETQDLGQLVGLCRDFDPATGAEYPVDIVVKSPFMAMRYPKTINAVRRIQVKFRSDLDFRKTLAIMKDLGLHITYKEDAVPAVAPSASPAPSVASSATVASGTSHAFANALPRPASSFTISASSVTGTSHLGASSPIQPEFKVPLRPDSAFYDSQRQASHIPYSTTHITMPFSKSPAASTLTFSPRSRVESFHQPPSQNHSLYVSQIERETQSRRTSQPILPLPSLDNPNCRTTASLYVSQLQSQRDEISEQVEAASKRLSASPFFSSASNMEALGAEKSHIFDSHRPSSTPVEHSDIQKMWIPPKRELPFVKQRQPSNALSSSAPDLQPTLHNPAPIGKPDSLPKAAEASNDEATTAVKKPAPKKRVAQRKAPSAKPAGQQLVNEELPAIALTEKSIPNLPSIQEEPEEPSPLAAKSVAASFRPASAPGLISKAIPPTRKRTAPPARPASSSKRPKMVDRGTQTQTLSGRDHTAAQRPPTSTPPDLVSDTASSTSPPESYLEELDAFIAKHNPQPRPKELWETPRYAEADAEQRQTMLNDFICENLDNADFFQLCCDAEFAWRRIGLGM